MNIVYTAITGGYDNLHDPQYVTKGWQYICFSDVMFKSNIWDVKVMRLMGDKAKWTKKIKILNHVYAPADISIWVDGQVEIIGDLNEFIAEIPKGNLIIPKHPYGNDLTKEVEACIRENLDNPDIIKSQINRYPKDKYDHTQNTIIVRRGDVSKAMNLWWDEVHNWSKRDQLSFGYSMRHTKQEYQTYDWELTKKYFKLIKHLWQK